MRTFLEWIKVVGAILLAVALGEIPTVREWSVAIDQQKALLVPWTLGVAVAGFLMLLWGFIGVAAARGRPMTGEEFDKLSADVQVLGPGKRFSKARFWGTRKDVTVPETGWRISDMKVAWRNGTWWRDPDMRRKYVITAGGIVTTFGMFAAFFVLVGPASVKLMIGAALLYALVRLAWGFWRA